MKRQTIKQYVDEKISNIVIGERIQSVPPPDAYPIVNIYVQDGKLEVQYDDQLNIAGAIISTPPINGFKVTNMYVENGTLKINYDNKL